MHVITCGNQKGGVAKTSTVVNLSDALGRSGYRVLVIDADAQGNTTSSMMRDLAQREAFSIVRALEAPIEDVNQISAMACTTSNENVDIVPNNILCMEWEKQAASTPDSVLGFKRLFKQDNQLSRYDYILIDTPPNIGVMVNNSLMVSDRVVVPIPVSDQYALDGFSTFLRLMNNIRMQNDKLQLMGVLLTKYDSRASSYSKNMDRIRHFFEGKGINVFRTVIRINVDISKAQAKRKTIFAYNDRTYGAKDYEALAQEVISLAQPSKNAKSGEKVA